MTRATPRILSLWGLARLANHKRLGWGRKKTAGGCPAVFGKGVTLVSLDDVCGDNGYAAVGGVPLNAAIDEGEEGEVATEADVGAWVVDGATLAHEDGACEDFLAVVALNAEAFAAAVTTVFGC